MNRINVGDIDHEELWLHFKDWSDQMANAFNGTPFPKEYPRIKSDQHTGFYHNGKYMVYKDLYEYVIHHAKLSDRVEYNRYSKKPKRMLYGLGD